jgi:glycosyltransferase involved in cell wall biosynthesis
MKVLVNASALDSRGGFTIIKDYLFDINKNIDALKELNIDNITVLVGNSLLKEYSNTVQNVIYDGFPKKSLFHKYYYENIYIRKYLIENNIDAYLSLQNVGIKNIGIPQVVLIHQPIPFSDIKLTEIEITNYIKYKILMNEYWKSSIAEYSGVIVQTDWMKNAIKAKYKYDKVEVIRTKTQKPKGDKIDSLLDIKFNNKEIKLLYVTNDEKYKNNDILIRSIDKYNSKADIKVILYLTIKGNDTNSIRYLGKIAYDKMGDLYKKVNALIYPSLVETLGLPLLEAQEYGLGIIAADKEYAHEICGDNAIYFDPRNENSIINSIKDYSLGKKVNTDINHKYNGSYIEYLKFLVKDVKRN